MAERKKKSPERSKPKVVRKTEGDLVGRVIIGLSQEDVDELSQADDPSVEFEQLRRKIKKEARRRNNP